MRTLLRVSVPVGKGNQTLIDGTLPQILERVLGSIHPEAAYFGAYEGKRTAFIVFDMADPSQIPGIAEPLFQGLDAELEFLPVMTQEDLAKGLAAAGQAGQAPR